MHEPAVRDLLAAAADGDQVAWGQLVDRFANLIWSIARSHRLSPAEAADVSQTTWLRLVEHVDRIRDPDRLGGWLATTARHECLRALRHSRRQIPLVDGHDAATVDPGSPDASVADAERETALWQAFEGLPERCRWLLRVLLADPPPSYEDVSAALGMPIGSIGPTRARCLARLRHQLEDAGITAGAPGS